MLDITTLAAWGEFIGGIAVVVSLIYLASQIRQNSKLLRVSATSTTAQITMSQNEMLCEDSEVLLAYDFSRLARNQEDLGWIRNLTLPVGG
jgi:hypothetical protein